MWAMIEKLRSRSCGVVTRRECRAQTTGRAPAVRGWWRDTALMDDPVASLYPDWPQYAARIRDAVKHLTDDQLALRAGPEHAPIWALAAHVAGTRVYWLCGVLQEPGADRTPFTEPLSDVGWED